MTIIKPTWIDLRDIVKSAEQSLLVCTPYYSYEGIGQVFDHLRDGLDFDLMTRLSPSDWVTGISNPESILSMLEIYVDSGTTARLYIHPKLHAKAYIADQKRGVLGSANLSAGGFQMNFELMVNLNEGQAANAAEMIRKEIGLLARLVSVEGLRGWVEESRDAIKNAKSRIPENDEPLTRVQRSLDEMLGYGTRRREQNRYTPEEMNRFVEWLKKNGEIPGAGVLLEHHENTQGGNRTGHFRQCFFIGLFFFEDNPSLCKYAATDIDNLNEKTLMHFDDNFIDSWITHITEHARDEGDYYNYSTLRAILSPSWGGTVMGGGGAIGTLKRMLRLLPKYIQESA